MVELLANNEDIDQTMRSAAFDLHCLPITRLAVSSLQRVNSFVE